MATPNQPGIISSKELSYPVYDNFKHFWKVKEYNDIDLFFLMLLDKVLKQEHELRDLKS
jgi:hypothetical protein